MRKHSRFARRALAVAALLSLTSGAAFPQAPAGPLSPATTRRPEGFGIDNYTVTVIPASSFTSDMSPTTDYGSTYRRFEPADSAGHLFAGAEVPAGAVIDMLAQQPLRQHLATRILERQKLLVARCQHRHVAVQDRRMANQVVAIAGRVLGLRAEHGPFVLAFG